MKTDYNKPDRKAESKSGDRRSDGEISIVVPESADRPTSEEIANLAYALWQERGCPDGSPEEDWYDAEFRLSSSTVEK